MGRNETDLRVAEAIHMARNVRSATSLLWEYVETLEARLRATEQRVEDLEREVYAIRAGKVVKSS